MPNVFAYKRYDFFNKLPVYPEGADGSTPPTLFQGSVTPAPLTLTSIGSISSSTTVSSSEQTSPPENPSFNSLLESLTLTSCTSCSGHMVLGDAEGVIHVIGRKLDTRSFQAFDHEVNFVTSIPFSDFMVGVGRDEALQGDVGPRQMVKVWNKNKWNLGANGDFPELIKTIPIKGTVKVTCVAVCDRVRYLALGFGDGSIQLIKADIVKDRNLKFISHQVFKEGVMHLSFGNLREVNSSDLMEKLTGKMSIEVTLYVGSEDNLHSILVKRHEEALEVIYEEYHDPFLPPTQNSAFSIMSMPSTSTTSNQPVTSTSSPSSSNTTEMEKVLIVGRNSSVDLYQGNERVQSVVYDGQKLILGSYRNYLVMVRPDIITGGDNVTIHDLSNKLTAYSGSFGHVCGLIQEWGSLYVVQQGAVYQLMEKDITSKLDLLFHKMAYDLAVEVGRSENYDTFEIAAIIKQHADDLLKKGEHEQAMNQYIKTIGSLEPSYVIERFLDSRLIPHLTRYLQELIKNKLGTKDHTTLLVNCYTRLDGKEELNKLTNDRTLDVDTSIQILIKSGFYQQASDLSRRHHQWSWFFPICIDNLTDPDEALKVLKNEVTPSQRLNLLSIFGRKLMDMKANETTRVAIEIVDDSLSGRNEVTKEMTGSMTGSAVIQSVDQMQDESEDTMKDLIAIFVHHPSKMLLFLETIVKKHPSCPRSFHNSLLDVYLIDQQGTPSVARRKEIQQRILEIVKSGANYDLDRALIMCTNYGFDDGLVRLFNMLIQPRCLLHHYIKTEQVKLMLSVCDDFQDSDPTLWLDALFLYTCNTLNGGDVTSSDEVIERVMEGVLKHRLMGPSQVVQLLQSKGNVVSLGAVKKGVTRLLSREAEAITANERQIIESQDESNKLQTMMNDLETTPKTFQSSRCASDNCNKPLDLPAIHFYCNHSYHQYCFESHSAGETECPRCRDDNRKLLSKIQVTKEARISATNLGFKEALIHSKDDVMTVITSFL